MYVSKFQPTCVFEKFIFLNEGIDDAITVLSSTGAGKVNKKISLTVEVP